MEDTKKRYEVYQKLLEKLIDREQCLNIDYTQQIEWWEAVNQ